MIFLNKIKCQYIQIIYFILAFSIILLICGHSITFHFKLSMSGDYFNDDIIQQIVPFLKYEDPLLFQKDYAADYFLNCMPIGFKTLYVLAAKIKQVLFLSQVLPYILLLITILFISLTLRKWGGLIAFIFTSLFILTADVYWVKMSGGLARSFGYPILAFGIWCIASGRMKLLPIGIILGASFYPSSAIPLGVMYGFILLFLPKALRGDAINWSLKSRCLILVITAIVSALLIYPNVRALKPYGSPITPKDIVDFPEASEGGRYGPCERAPFPSFFKSINKNMDLYFHTSRKKFIPKLEHILKHKIIFYSISYRTLIFWLYWTLALIGFIILVLKEAGLKRLLILFMVLYGIYVFACKVSPYFYMPERYISYPLPLLLTVFFITGFFGLGQLSCFKNKERAGKLLIIIFCSSFFLLYSGCGKNLKGLSVYKNKEKNAIPVYNFINSLPKNVVIAGWPNGIVNYMSYISERQIFLNFEVHQAFHKNYALEMRTRMHDFITAYYSMNASDIAQFRDKYKIDYLIINLQDYLICPKYFKPFDNFIKITFNNFKKMNYNVVSFFNPYSILKSENYMVIDLNKIVE